MGVTPLLPADTTALILVVLGLIVGFINIGVKETHDFLVAVIALLLAGTAGLGNLPAIGTYIGAILTNITTFVAPAAVIVALKAVWELARKTG
jgi:hypothetical protein